MSEFLGARISLISNSDIRYVGTLDQINSEDSTVSLENVRSYGTEGRIGRPEDEVPPSEQTYEYIVFRGTDVKDLRIEEAPTVAKENKPPAVPNDPAIMSARARPGNAPPVQHRAPAPHGPPAPQGPPPGPHGMPNPQGPPPGAPGFGYYPPPNMGGWGRAGPPGPGAFGGMPGQYPPPPQWFPQGQEFPPNPMGGPGPWNNYAYPPGPGGPHGAPTGPGQQGRQSASHTPNNLGQAPKPVPIGPASDRKSATPAQQQQPTVPSEPKSLAQAPIQPAHQPAPVTAPPPPVESKPSVEEVKATAASIKNNAAAAAAPQSAPKAAPTGPKTSRPTQILPAVPLPVALTSRQPQQGQASSSKTTSDITAAAIRDATQAAKAAVATAMANMNAQAAEQQSNSTPVNNLAKKVNEMRVSAPRQAQAPPAAVRGGGDGRGRAPRTAKVEVPETDFDFASSNAKFNKQDVVKEAIAGSPLTEAPHGESPVAELVPDATGAIPPAYNKSKSFFDNISSEAKDRLENNGQKPGGREWRGEEQRKNMETFGQGSVDGSFRGYRGRGRGRGGRGRGYRGGGRGNNINNAAFRPRDAAPTAP